MPRGLCPSGREEEGREEGGEEAAEKKTDEADQAATDDVAEDDSAASGRSDAADADDGEEESDDEESGDTWVTVDPPHGSSQPVLKRVTPAETSAVPSLAQKIGCSRGREFFFRLRFGRQQAQQGRSQGIEEEADRGADEARAQGIELVRLRLGCGNSLPPFSTNAAPVTAHLIAQIRPPRSPE